MVVTRMLPAAVHVIVNATVVVSARVTLTSLGFGSATVQLSAIPVSRTLCVPALNGVMLTVPLVGMGVLGPPSTSTAYPSGSRSTPVVVVVVRMVPAAPTVIPIVPLLPSALAVMVAGPGPVATSMAESAVPKTVATAWLLLAQETGRKKTRFPAPSRRAALIQTVSPSMTGDPGGATATNASG